MANPTHKSAEEVFEQVRQLDPEEREKLDELLAAENESKFFATPEIEQAWLEEARRRSQLRVEGKTRAIAGEDFFAELRQKYTE